MQTRIVAILFLAFAATAGSLACETKDDGEPTERPTPSADTEVADVDARLSDTLPGADVADTVAETDAPSDDTAAPSADTAAPSDDTAAPTADTAAPSADTATPPQETTAPPDDSPTAFIQRQTDDVTELLAQEASPERAEQYSAKVQEIVDFRMLASQALGEYWEARTEQEREEFLSLLQQLLEANYKRRLEGQTVGEDFTVDYLDTRQRGDRAIVDTLIIWGEGAEERTSVSYKLARQAGGWTIYDIVIDDVSLVASYRDSYTQVIREEGWEVLIEKMEARIEELEGGAGGEPGTVPE